MEVSLTLLLTIAAYKQSMWAVTPQISYLTLLDSYWLFSAIIVILVAIEGTFSSFITAYFLPTQLKQTVFGTAWWSWREDFPVSEIDLIMCGVNVVMVLMLHVYFFCRIRKSLRRTADAYGRAFKTFECENTYFDHFKEDDKTNKMARRDSGRGSPSPTRETRKSGWQAYGSSTEVRQPYGSFVGQRSSAEEEDGDGA